MSQAREDDARSSTIELMVVVVRILTTARKLCCGMLIRSDVLIFARARWIYDDGKISASIEVDTFISIPPASNQQPARLHDALSALPSPRSSPSLSVSLSCRRSLRPWYGPALIGETFVNARLYSTTLAGGVTQRTFTLGLRGSLGTMHERSSLRDLDGSGTCGVAG